MSTVSNRAMAELCGRMKTEFSSYGMMLFEEIDFGDIHAAFLLATDDCGFLIDRVRRSLIRDYHKLNRSVVKLTAQDTGARIFGILLLDETQEHLTGFRRFGMHHDIALVTADGVYGFLKEKLEADT